MFIACFFFRLQTSTPPSVTLRHHRPHTCASLLRPLACACPLAPMPPRKEGIGAADALEIADALEVKLEDENKHIKSLKVRYSTH